MADHQPTSRNETIVRLLSYCMVLLFAGLLIFRLTPLGGDPAQAQSTGTEAGEHDMVTITMQLEGGPVKMELWPDVAPNHVERITTLAEQGFYDGIVFHRVIDGFMAQTGDPTGTGRGGSDLPDLDAEFSEEPFERGTLGMARSQDPNSANSQFFITYQEAPHLDGQYTVFGEVVSGMEHVDALKKGDQAQNGLVENPDAIVSMSVDSEQ